MSELEPLDVVAYRPFLEAALAEDCAREDVTTAALLDRPGAQRRVRAEMVAKADGVVAGLPLVETVFQLLDPASRVEPDVDDGENVSPGMTLLWVETSAAALLQGERTALNIVQRLSGVATIASQYTEHTMATGSHIYDTRKTTPGLRHLEKYAVRCGGARNHRMDLADAAMIKENHLVAAYGETGVASIAKAVTACLAGLPEHKTLYVEVETQAELEAAVAAAGPRAAQMVVMLDDFELGDLRAAVRWLRTTSGPRPVIEATGGVTVETIPALAAAGAARISTGAITHSAKALDISLKIRSRL